MSKLIVKTPIPHERYYEAIRQMYLTGFYPRVLLQHFKILLNFKKYGWRTLFAYGLRAVRRASQHIFNLTVHSDKKSGLITNIISWFNRFNPEPAAG